MRPLRKVAGLVVACTTSLLWSVAAEAQSDAFARECKPFIDAKGYSTDYIEQKTGKRQSGMASRWRGNVPLEQVKPGDVLLISLRAPGAQHAALVEDVRKRPDGTIGEVLVSEWNWGRVVNQRCLVTDYFGKLSPSRWVDPYDAPVQVWRPSQPF